MVLTQNTLKNFSLAFICYVLSITVASAAPPETGETSKGVEAPYFFIEGDDSGLDRLPLKTTTANVTINGFIAGVELTQTYRNEGNQTINATYIFPGSTNAAVNGMTMDIGDRRIVAKIKEKEQAKQVFQAAKKAGKTASLLSQQRPNVFSMKVANILPGDEVTVSLTYTEILTVEEGLYEFVYPGVVGPRYGGDAQHTQAETQWLQNPYLAQGTPDPVAYDIHVTMASPLPIASLQSPSHQLNALWESKKTAKLSLKNSPDAGNRDFILHYRLQDNHIQTGLSHFNAGDEHYFLLVAEPPKRIVPAELPARDYFFVVDVSGSMTGFPLATTKQLMSNLLSDLQAKDRFNILFFAGGSQVLSPHPLAATPENIRLAEQMMSRQFGGGGTNLYEALNKAFSMDENKSADRSRNIVLISDGYISAEDRVFQLIDDQLHRNNVFAFGVGSSVNRYLMEGIAQASRSAAFIVTSQKEAAQQSVKFNNYIKAPVLTNISVAAKGVELYDLEPNRFPDLLGERAIMVIGKIRHISDNAVITLRGVNGQGEQSWSFPLAHATVGDTTLPQLWARKKLQRLYVIPEGSKEQQRTAVVELGLKYSLLTSQTSFVAVDETVRNNSATDKDVKQPLPLPAGVTNNATGQPMPEPDLLWIGLLGLFGLAFRRWRHGHAS